MHPIFRREVLYFLCEGFCDRALPAAVLDALLVRPSRRTFDAALAAFAEVTLFAMMFAPFIFIA